MNKHGFTLVELLVVLVIIGFIGGIAVVAYNSLIRQSEKKVYEEYENTMHAETIYLLQHNPQLLPKLSDGEKKFYLSDIGIEKISNPRNKSDYCPASFVGVTRDADTGSVDSFTYRVCLICSDYNSDGNSCKTFDN